MSLNIFSLLRSSFTYGIGGLFNQALGILILPLFTAYLSPADFGIASILAISSTILVSLFSLGLGTSFGICYYDNVENQAENQKKIFGSSIIVMSCSSLILLALLAVFEGTLSNFLFSNYKYLNLVRLYFIYTVSSLLTGPVLLKFQFEEKKNIYVFLTLISTSLSLGLSFVFVVVLEYGLTGYISGLVIGKLLGTILGLISAFYKAVFSWSKKTIISLLVNGAPLVPSALIIYFLQEGNIFFITKLLGVSQAGIYSVAFSYGSAISLLTSSFAVAWWPFCMKYKSKQKDVNPLFGEISLLYIGFISIISVLFFVFSEPVFLFLDKKFYSGYYVVGPSAIYHFIAGLQTLFLPLMFYSKDQKILVFFQALSLCFYLIYAPFFVKSIGLLGASLSIILCFVNILLFIFCWNNYKYSKGDYIKINYEIKKIVIIIFLILIYISVYYYCNSFSWKLNLKINILSAFLFLSVLLFILKKDVMGLIKDFYKK